MIDDEDVRLMLRFKQGEREAFETLFRRYTPKLMNFLARMIHDRHRAEDLTQEVFVRIHQARERYEPRARFSTWMFGIASRLALNELARAHRERERPLADSELGDRVSPNPGPDEALSAAQTAHDLQRVLGALPERQRLALLLRSEQGLGYDEISQALGTSVSSVKSLLHRGRETLLAELKRGRT